MKKLYLSEKPQEMVVPFSLEKTQEMVAPFSLEKPQGMITPFSLEKPKQFTVENMEKIKEKTIIPAPNEVVPPKIRPIEFLSEGVKQIAKNLCMPLQSTFGDDTESLAPYIGQALQNYKNSGHELPCTLPAICQNSATGYFNFNMVLKKKIIYIRDMENEEIAKTYYHVNVWVYLKNGQIQNYESEVESNKIKTYTWLTHATNSLAKLPKGKDERIAFEKMIQDCIETQNIPIELIYPNAGWRNIPDIGWRYVYGEGAVGVNGRNIHTKKRDENFCFATKQISQSEIFREALEMRKICKSRSASTILLLFTHAATIETFFEESGFPINFILGVVGVTNSRKTSLELEITRIFNTNRKRADAEFTATAAGIEKTLSKYKDAPILIDDFRPGETRTEQLELNKRLESLVRFYGNRIPKKRMDDFSGKKDKFFPIQGICVITMEVVTGVQSSLSRMMIVDIDKNEFQNNILSYYQQNSWILSSHLYDFILWETENQNDILRMISNQMPRLRTKYNFEFQRFGEMFAVFHLIAELIGSYAQNRGFWSPEEFILFVQECDDITISLLRNMEKRLKISDKGILIVNALLEAIESGKISPIELNSENCKKNASIYMDDTYIFIRAKILKKLSEDYCIYYKIDTVFVNEDDIISALERLEILAIYENKFVRERSRKLPIQHGNHLRYLYLHKKN